MRSRGRDPCVHRDIMVKLLEAIPNADPTDVTGNPATFTAERVSPITALKVHFSPVQTGEGDPSPENVRPITGWTSVTVYQSGEDTSDPDIYPVTFPAEAGTVYGGYVDLVNGELVAEWAFVDLGTLTLTYRSELSGGAFTTALPQSMNRFKPKDRWVGLCNKLLYVGDYNALTNKSQGIGFVYLNGIIIKDTNITIDDPAVMKAALDGTILCYELATPVSYPITPLFLKTLRGTNNIWSNANGNIELTY